MSATTSTVPPLLKNETLPSADRSTVTAFGTGFWPPTKLRLEATGCGASDGKTVRNESAVGLTAVTLSDTAVASTGIVQLPLVPVIAIVCVSAAPIGFERAPTVCGAGRVSITR